MMLLLTPLLLSTSRSPERALPAQSVHRPMAGDTDWRSPVVEGGDDLWGSVTGASANEVTGSPIALGLGDCM